MRESGNIRSCEHLTPPPPQPTNQQTYKWPWRKSAGWGDAAVWCGLVMAFWYAGAVGTVCNRV